uniref:Regulatory protein zeste n=1 Tax=Spodoptera frugiperda TaxID=7108 RepID=A0A2H1V0Q7_SPOFR
MDKTTDLGSNRPVSSKKFPFTSVERELIVKLVRDRPVIEDKRTNAKNIELKKRAWEDLTVVYNSQPYVSRRNTYQLKRCWENIKTLRKRELRQKSSSLKRTGTHPDDSSAMSDNFVDTICPFSNVGVPGVIDSNTIEMIVDTHEQECTAKLEPDNRSPSITDIVLESESILNENTNNNSRKITSLVTENELDESVSSEPNMIYNNEIFSTPTSKKKLVSEIEARIKRTTINMQHDQELHELRMKREKILLARESNLLQFEKKIQELQILKAKLEIQLLNKQFRNKTS